jgi:tRNA/tmRNA/rRNA uracil-C5-methylase (TrmA/RlmC/RlmD family)
MLRPGDAIELAVDKPAAGGHMLARHEGQVVFVRGAIPGERVRVRIERSERQLAFATLVDVLEASPDRRTAAGDPACGGCSYAHVQYGRQLRLKADVIHDAFARLARAPLDRPVAVQASPERGYRMRARFHVGAAGVGFYREGTHDVCDAAQTGQMLDECVAAVASALPAAAASAPVVSAWVAENVAADQRVLHLQTSAGDTPVPRRALEAARSAGQLTGCSAHAGGRLVSVGSATVADPLTLLTGGRAGSGTLQRHAESFFQANRHLISRLVGDVLDSVPDSGEVLDLYAGVGLFAVSLAQSGRERITAVEGDRTSARDLAGNAASCGASLRVVQSSVEDHLAHRPRRPGTIIVDPPRTGISRAAMEAVIRCAPARVVYVSCDPPTMARDARRLLDGGYRLSELRAYDLFPNTPHVESLGLFDRG